MPGAATDERVAAVDCGTNSIRLLVADLRPGTDGTARAVEVLRRTEIVRLGYGVDRTGLLDPEALDRTLAMSREYAAQCERLGATRVRFVATSATRDAGNAGDFIDGVRLAFAPFGIGPEVVSGREEAQLSFVGATAALRDAEVPGPYLVVDIGGGSTELARGRDRIEASCSVDIGSVRLTERHLHDDPPSQRQVDAARADIDAALDHAAGAVRLDGIATLVGLAGSVTTVTAHAMSLPAYDRARIDLTRLPSARIIAACVDLLAMTREQRATLPYLHPGRVDVIGAGALIWQRVVERLRDNGTGFALTSEHDILDGIALSLAPAEAAR